jgi:metal-responsive CopG/Arc/MetJ family transcriptional regulator
MTMVRMLIQVPKPLKAKLDALRNQGTTASGFVRHLIEKEFRSSSAKNKGRQRRA